MYTFSGPKKLCIAKTLALSYIYSLWALVMEVEFSNFYAYYDHLVSLIDEQTWEAAELASVLLCCRDKHADLKFLQVSSPEERYDDRAAVQWAVFDELVMLHLNVLHALSASDWQAAFGHQTNALQLFNREILQREKDANWFIPILYALCSDLRLVARIADKHGCVLWNSHQRKTADAQTATFYEESASPIMESYRICVAERSDATTKKVAILNLTNQLFRIYFAINRLHLLKPLIRSIDHVGELYERFSLADKITYKYFLGRKAMFDMDLPRAEESLTFAFEHCSAQFMRNKRLILMYLIPVKMFLGHMPTQQLLIRHNLGQFADVVTSVKDGNLRDLNLALQKHQHFFIKCGIFLMLEKLKVITYRNLFKRVASILNTHLIKLDAFLAVLRFLGTDIDADELACILANLIAQKKIKGYISHQKQTLVISKQTPFPSLSAA